jgi:hypothetical protein
MKCKVLYAVEREEEITDENINLIFEKADREKREGERIVSVSVVRTRKEEK